MVESNALLIHMNLIRPESGVDALLGSVVSNSIAGQRLIGREVSHGSTREVSVGCPPKLRRQCFSRGGRGAPSVTRLLSEGQCYACLPGPERSSNGAIAGIRRVKVIAPYRSTEGRCQAC